MDCVLDSVLSGLDQALVEFIVSCSLFSVLSSHLQRVREEC